MNDTLADEVTSINSIYDESTLAVVSESPLICTLKLPSLPSVSLRLEFPPSYPDAPPSVLGTQSVGEHIPKGVGKEVAEKVRRVLAETYRPGDACIFDLIEELGDLAEAAEAEAGAAAAAAQPPSSTSTSTSHDDHHHHQHQQDQHAETHSKANDTDLLPPNGDPPPWTLSEPITEKKSIFLARAAPVTSPAQAKQYLQHLIQTDKRVARATHNITAWRIQDASNPAVSYQDCDDEGETAAGGRVLHLMQLMDVWNVMVVVTRWYGGVQLGPDRFRIINSSARGALVAGGFAREEKGEKGEGLKKKGKK